MPKKRKARCTDYLRSPQYFLCKRGKRFDADSIFWIFDKVIQQEVEELLCSLGVSRETISWDDLRKCL